MRRPIIAGNWKMFKLINESVETASELKTRVASSTHCDIVIAPVFTALSAVSNRIEGSNVLLAAQNCSEVSDYAARTGDITASMVKDAGCSIVILGHSERRQFYGESDEIINRKVHAAIGSGLSAIVCVGESLAERENGQHEGLIERQLSGSLLGLTVSDMERIIIAYEPVWAIGTGKTASPQQAQEMHRHIRSVIGRLHGENVSANIRILYGGSVKPENIRSIMDQDDVDGALVGGASLEAEVFAKIVDYK